MATLALHNPNQYGTMAPTLDELMARMDHWQRLAESVPVESTKADAYWAVYQDWADKYDALIADLDYRLALQAEVDDTHGALLAGTGRM